MNEKKEIEPRNIAITEFNQEKLSIEQIINIRNRSQTLKPNNFKFTPHLYPKKNNINVSPIHNYFKSNEEKTNISLTQSLLLKRSPDSFSSPNSEELNENNNKELYDDLKHQNEKIEKIAFKGNNSNNLFYNKNYTEKWNDDSYEDEDSIKINEKIVNDIEKTVGYRIRE